MDRLLKLRTRKKIAGFLMGIPLLVGACGAGGQRVQPVMNMDQSLGSQFRVDSENINAFFRNLKELLELSDQGLISLLDLEHYDVTMVIEVTTNSSGFVAVYRLRFSVDRDGDVTIKNLDGLPTLEEAGVNSNAFAKFAPDILAALNRLGRESGDGTPDYTTRVFFQSNDKNREG